MTTTLFVVLQSGSGISSSHAADLNWEVENPYRFFKRSASFEMHEKAFAAVRGAPGQPLPSNILWKVERRLNDPDCKDASTPTSCLETARAGFAKSRLGWASQTVEFNCYDRNARPRHYMVSCDRQYSWGTAKEDYILPDAHTVVMHIGPEAVAAAGPGDCMWTWQGRRAGAAPETRKQACKDKLVIKRVPFSLNRALSGVSVKVAFPNGAELAEPNVTVEDVFVVAMGDCFASGESNPDRPVTFSAARQMLYDPINYQRDIMATRTVKPLGDYGVASSSDFVNPKALPKRLLEDEEKGLIFKPNSREFQDAFDRRAAQWLSADCHRSQYGYPFRVSIGLALENRHRAVTFVSLACSGADIVEGLFSERDPREQFSGPNGQKQVVAQFDQLSDLICRNGAAGRTRAASYRLPVYSSGSTSISEQVITKQWCPPESRKRADRRRAALGRRQRRRFRCAGHLRHDRKRERHRPDRRPDRSRGSVFAGRFANLPARARSPLEGGQGRLERRFRRRSFPGAAERLRADPVRRDRQCLRRAADARPRRASEAALFPRTHPGSLRLRARAAGPAGMHQRLPASQLPGRASPPAPAPASG